MTVSFLITSHILRISLTIFYLFISFKFQLLLLPTNILFTILILPYLLTIILYSFRKSIIKSFKNQIINKCTLITHLTVPNTFFLQLSKQKRYVTVDSPQPFTITISLKIFFLRLRSLNYHSHLFKINSFPFLPFNRRVTRNRRTNKHSTPTIFYKTKYNKHIRTDKLVRRILYKYHNKHLPSFTKTYTNSTKLHSLFLTNKKLHNKLNFKC